MAKTKIPQPQFPTAKIDAAEWFDDRFYRVEGNTPGEIVNCNSVTTELNAILRKPGMERWRGDVGNFEADRRGREAMDRGSRVHAACFQLVSGGAVAIHSPWNKKHALTPERIEELKAKYGAKLIFLEGQDEYLLAVRYKEWLERVKPKVVAAEQTIFHIKRRLAGTCDAIMWIEAGTYEVNGSKPLVITEAGFYLIDYKTGAKYDDHVLQLSAYTHLAEDCLHITIAGALNIYLDSSTKGGIKGVATVLYSRALLDAELENFWHVDALYKARNPNLEPEVFEYPAVIEGAEMMIADAA